MAGLGVFVVVVDAEGSVLCVKRAYARKNWTLPGGGVDPGESPRQAAIRECLEESGYSVNLGRYVGTYSNPLNDDLVLCFSATITGRQHREPDHEIEEVRFFPPEALPDDLSIGARARVHDALEGRSGVYREYDPATGEMRDWTA